MARISRFILIGLVAEHAAVLTLYARQWLDGAAAEDVVQEALTALLAQVRMPEEPLAWMYRAVRNAAIDALRSASRRRRRERLVAQGRAEWFTPAADVLFDAREAEAVLQRLADVHREIVVLRIWGDLSFPQIAEILDLSVSTIHERYTAALTELRSRLENPCRNHTMS